MPIIRRKDERKGFTILGKFGGGQPQPIDYSKEYFFIEDVSGEENRINVFYTTGDMVQNTPSIPVQVSTDKVNWVDITGDGYTIQPNGRLYVKCVANRWGVTGKTSGRNYFVTLGNYNVGGNIMSLLYGDEYIDKYKLEYDYTFTSLFGYSKVIDASKLVLPATTLVTACYSDMFNGCSSLTTAPELPATTLKIYCYKRMFSGCSSLTTAPELPATTLSSDCYFYMFQRCTALTEAPALPATTLVTACYLGMFSGCTSLNKVITYANDISATNSTISWLFNVSPTGDFYNLGGAEYSRGESGIPKRWTEHTTLE